MQRDAPAFEPLNLSSKPIPYATDAADPFGSDSATPVVRQPLTFAPPDGSSTRVDVNAALTTTGAAAGLATPTDSTGQTATVIAIAAGSDEGDVSAGSFSSGSSNSSQTTQSGAESDPSFAPESSVTDENDNAPVFDSGTTASTSEATATGTVVYTATTTDEDTVGTVSYSLADSDGGRFAIDAVTGDVTLVDPLDYETTDNHAFTVRVFDGVNTTDQTVTLTVTDENDNAPVFDSGTSASTSEATATGTVVYTASATDEDTVGSVSYSLTDSDGGRFAIDAITGAVTLVTALDFETNDSHAFTVRAFDGTNTTDQTVTLTVTDENDNAPVFDSGTTASTSEATATGTVVYTATTTDEDTVGSVSYSLTDSDGGRFAIDAVTGDVTLVDPLDYETADSHAFTVRAFDGVNTTDQTVTLSVTDENDNAPVFDSGASASTSEATATGTVVYTASASDEDTVGTVSYSLTDDDGGRFAIDAVTGAVTLVTALDFETSDSHAFTVRAFDGVNTTDQTVTLTVTDENDNAPVFDSGTTASTSEATATGTVVYTASTTDEDTVGSVSYSLADSDGGRFAIDAATGAVTLVTALNYETSDSHTFTVRAFDGANTTDQTVTLTVTDENDNAPVFDSGTSASTSEATATGSVVYTASTTDEDTVGSVSYSLADSDGGRFAIDAVTGDVTVVDPLDYETSDSQAFTVRAFDGVNTTDQTVTLSVTDENDNAPVFDSGTGVSTSEATATGTIIYTAGTTDEDTVGTVSYSLTDSDGGRFAIDAITGAVTLVTALDFETADSHAFTVRAFDGVNTTDQTVTLSVTDENDNAPVFDSGNTATTSEATATGSVIYTASTTDEDTVGSVSYSLTDDDGGRFAIDAVTGDVTLVDPLDYETSDSHAFTVRAFDGTNTTDQTVTLSVTDENDNAPVFDSGTSTSTSEATATGTVVYTASATDQDTVGSVSYSLADDDGGRFAIDAVTGDVTVVDPLDYETSDSQAFTVRAFDGVNTTDQTVTLSVTDENDNAPVFDSGTSASTSEATATGTVVYTASTTDEDTVGSVSYSLTDSDGGRFAIDAATGAVTLVTALDFETADSHTFTVRAFDGVNTTDQTVTLSVTDENDNAPVFDSGTGVSASEATATGSVVYAASASDEDTVGTVSYSLTDSDGGRFAIDAVTGDVTLVDPLDYETADSHAFTVRAFDGTNTTDQTVTLSVTDENDNAPVFVSGTTAATSEATATGTVVYTASTTDEDTVGSVSYSLADSDGGRFAIDAVTGAVTLVDPLDYETADSHAFTVRAFDGTNTTDQTVTLSVIDENEAPTAVGFGNVIAMDENTDTSSGVKVADILITDDALGTEVITLSGADADAFQIRNETELFFVGSTPDYESQDAYNVTVSIDDTSVGNTPDATQDFTLTINDVNEAPTDVSFANAISIDENTDTSSGVKVADILITDDALGTEVITLSGADADAFQIRNETELFFVGSTPDYESQDAYNVTVSIDDTSVGNTPDATQNFTLTINDVNEAPVAQNDTNADDPVTEDLSVTLLNIQLGDSEADGNVLTNDSDPDAGDSLTVVGVAAGEQGGTPSTGVGATIVGTYGSITLQTDGSWHYDLDNDDADTNALGQIGQPATGTDVFTYAVSDTHGAITTATVSITIQGALDLFGF